MNLAKRVVSDGEGASKFITINVKNCKNEMSLEEIAISCDISKSVASKRLQILESLNVIKKIKVEKKIKFCRN